MEQFKFHTDKLRASGLRPTKQRLAISKVLFDRKETFHFTIEKLKKITEKDGRKKISLARLYMPPFTLHTPRHSTFQIRERILGDINGEPPT